MESKKKVLYKKNVLDDCFKDYLYEEQFLLDYLNENKILKSLVKKFRTPSTEIWLNVIYKADRSDEPHGVFIGDQLIRALADIDCSLSTDMEYV